MPSIIVGLINIEIQSVLFRVESKKQHFGATEDDRIRRHIAMSDEEKFRMFMRMLRLHHMMKRAKISHYQYDANPIWRK
jgi:hypothetical protein